MARPTRAPSLNRSVNASPPSCRGRTPVVSLTCEAVRPGTACGAAPHADPLHRREGFAMNKIVRSALHCPGWRDRGGVRARTIFRSPVPKSGRRGGGDLRSDRRPGDQGDRRGSAAIDAFVLLGRLAPDGTPIATALGLSGGQPRIQLRARSVSCHGCADGWSQPCRRRRSAGARPHYQHGAIAGTTHRRPGAGRQRPRRRAGGPAEHRGGRRARRLHVRLGDQDLRRRGGAARQPDSTACDFPDAVDQIYLPNVNDVGHCLTATSSS